MRVVNIKKMDEVIARLLPENEMNFYLEKIRDGKYRQIELIKNALRGDNYELINEEKHVTYLENKSIGEKGYRVDFIYSTQYKMKIIIQLFLSENVQETTAYVLEQNKLIYEYFIDNEMEYSDDGKGFIKNHWNGDVILEPRKFEGYKLPW